MGLGTLALRSAVGGIILAHGLQKLNGSFEGPGLEGTEKMMESLGLHPPKYQAWAVALSETVGGGLTAAGFLSPLGPAMIIGSQAVAVQKVHRKNGFWLHNRGYEYNLALIAGAFALAESGPGALSLDAVFGKRRRGIGWALTSAALALGAAAATLKVADRLAPKSPQVDGAEREAAPAGGTGAGELEDAASIGAAGSPVEQARSEATGAAATSTAGEVRTEREEAQANEP
jgi:putative oxidoreductase